MTASFPHPGGAPAFRHPHPRSRIAQILALVSVILLPACSGSSTITRSDPLEATAATPHPLTELEVQSLIMSMADAYGAALGEAIYLLARSDAIDPKGRWLAQSFLRNGMGAAIDIAAGPNPRVGLLDLLVLAALQSWTFEKHWIPAGIDAAAGEKALARLRVAETELWASSRRVLSEDQTQRLRALVAQWIAAHPEQTVVSLVRFDEFTDQRRLPASEARAQASGLLADVEKATAAVEDAELLGERLIWFAGRLPYVLGQQAELTAYRMADQPEMNLLRETLTGLAHLVEVVAERSRTLEADLVAQQEAFFTRLRQERTTTFEDLAGRIATERDATLTQAFDRLSGERKQMLEEVQAKLADVGPALADVRRTVEVTDTLAQNVTRTATALDAVITHFDRPTDDPRAPIDLAQLTAAAVEAAHTAERLTALLERADAALASPQGRARLQQLDEATTTLLDRIFWRGAGLVALLLIGLGALRFWPRRVP